MREIEKVTTEDAEKLADANATVDGGTHAPAAFVAYPGAHAHEPAVVATW